METTATSKGQIVIPVEVRRHFGIRKGTRITVRVDRESNEIVLTPITPEYIKNLRGIDHGQGLVEDLAQARARDRDREERSRKRSANRPKKKR